MTAATAGPSLLVVDDQESQLKLMNLLLLQAFPRCTIASAPDAVAALELCDERAFDCVLCDYNMPDMNGLELAARLRELRPHLAFVLCTGAGDEMLAAEALSGGVTQYLPKTRVSPDSLRRTVRHAIEITRQSRQIAEQREELEHFANALAHDFKQPIRQIGAFSKLIQEAMPPDADAELALHFRFLRQAAARLGRLVEVMSDYALLGQRPELGRVDLVQACGEVRALLESYIAERGALVEVEGAAVALGNETLVAQVLQNLVVNAVKYNTSARPEVHVRLQASRERCLVTVSDNGIGIAAEQLERIFQPLVRLHTEAAFEGSGLGLAMTRKAVQAQGGKVWARSDPGRGSQFLVELPAWSAGKAAGAAAGGPAATRAA